MWLMKGKEILAEKDSLIEWIKKSRDGDMKAFESIYEHFKSPVFNLVYRYTKNHTIAEDLVHDIFLKAFTNIKKLREEKVFVNWFYRIAINTCLDHLRKNKKEKLDVSFNDGKDYAQIHTNARENVIKNEILELAIEKLPLKMKTVFLLHDVQGFKHKEIAKILKCSVGTSKSQLFKARKKIREYLIKKKGI